jgi:hypothetical protein
MHRSFELDVPADVRSLARLRARFGTWLEGCVSDDFVRSDLVLTMSEMAAAALPTTGSHRGSLRARAWSDDDSVVIEVVDGDGSVLDARARSLDADDGGRGLAVIATLADVLTVDDAAGATSIRARVSW